MHWHGFQKCINFAKFYNQDQLLALWHWWNFNFGLQEIKYPQFSKNNPDLDLKKKILQVQSM